MDSIASALRNTDVRGLRVCEFCDTVHRRQPLARGEVALCQCCGAVMERHQRLGPDALLALVLTAMIAFVMANAWPIIVFTLNGHPSGATLWGMISTMWRERAEVVSVLAALTLFFFPLLRMLMLGWVLLFARGGTRAPGFAVIMVALHRIRPWTMSEVFVLGVLVSVVKGRVYFGIEPQPGVYGYALLTFIITLFATVDLRHLWDLTRKRSA